MNEEQRYAFDTWGYLVVEDAITPQQVAELRDVANEKGADLNSQHKKDGGFWSQAFVDLLDMPTISPLLDEIYGGAPPSGLPAFRIDHINVHTHGVFNKALAGGTIHNFNQRRLNPDKPDELQPLYSERDTATGSFRNGLVAVAYELEDTVCNDGGFCCLPGSHKANYRIPAEWVDLSKGVHPMIRRIPARPGTAIIFTEALSHGTLPWIVPNRRTTLFYKYTALHEAYAGEANYFDRSDVDQWPGADARKRTILSPPPKAWVERKRSLAEQAA